MQAGSWRAALPALAVSALVGGLVPWLVGDASAGEGTVTTIAATNLRKAPATESEILARIPKGSSVAVGACRDGWCRVSWNGRDGYAIMRNLGAATARAPAAWPGFDRWASQSFGMAERAGAHEEHEADARAVIFEFGAIGEWPLNGERANFGGTIGAEVTPIENWLEIEFSLATLATAGHTELSEDLLFKKPFELSPTVEFMIGAGPSFSQVVSGPDRGSSAVSAEVALDFMFWPTKNLGWYFEPTWSVNPRTGQQSVAASIGILVGFPKP